MSDENVEMILSSSRSMEISLTDIRNGEAGLNAHRQTMLSRVPDVGDWASFTVESIELKDLAYLTAKTGHEFALLRGKKQDILFHGTAVNCRFVGALYDLLIEHKLTIIGHSHPGEDIPDPSSDDRQVLLKIGQYSSKVISGRTGRITEFTADPFEV